jgi:flagellar protein FlaG
MSVTSVVFNPALSPPPFATDIRVQPAKQNDNNSQEVKEKPQAIHSTAADLQRMGIAFSRKLQFVVDQDSNQVIVKVIDKETDKVIKELPPEELQKLHRYLKEAVGLLFDEMV